MNARGTRRPHSRRVYKQGRTRASGGGGGGQKSCPLSIISVPVGLARGLLAELTIRSMGAVDNVHGQVTA